jgi:hypothetical protein
MKQYNIGTYIILATALVLSCKSKDKNEKKQDEPFPALSFIKSQVAHVDTSVYPIKKIILIDSTSDTTDVRREDFRALAADFINTPDITEKKYRKGYQFENRFDTELGMAIFSCTPLQEDLEVRRQEVLIVPNPPNDKVKSIYIEKYKSNKDSSLMQRLTWNTDKSFMITNIVSKNGQPDKIITTKVMWQWKTDSFDPSEEIIETKNDRCRVQKYCIFYSAETGYLQIL